MSTEIHTPHPTALSLAVSNERGTEAFARAAARAALRCMGVGETMPQAGLSLYLRGSLGAGKTTFVRYFLRELGITGRIKSPTYGLAESYDIAPHLSLWHFDFYRLDKPGEWLETGFAELWSQPCIRLVEWPEKAADTLPAADVTLQIEADVNDEGKRRLSATATSAQGTAWLAEVRVQLDMNALK